MHEMIGVVRLPVLLAAGLLVLTGCRSDTRDDAAPTTVSPTTVTATTAITPTTTIAPTTEAAPTTESVAPPIPEFRPAVEPVGTVTHEAITVDGTVRTFRLYVPSSLPEGPVPLILGLHGGTGTADQFANADHLESLAEANGFIAVHPDGTPQPATTGGVWNGGACCGVAARTGVDDVAFVRDLIDLMGDRFAIDPARVGALGHSNGAIMSYRLACELADRVTAVGMYAGTLAVDSCTPSEPVSLLHVHGDADRNIPIDGGRGDQGLSQVDFPSPRAGFERFAAAESCPAPTISTEGDLTIDRREPCASGTTLEFVTIAGATHGWPGSTAARVPASGPVYAGMDATAVIVEFLLGHPRAG